MNDQRWRASIELKWIKLSLMKCLHMWCKEHIVYPYGIIGPSLLVILSKAAKNTWIIGPSLTSLFSFLFIWLFISIILSLYFCHQNLIFVRNLKFSFHFLEILSSFFKNVIFVHTETVFYKYNFLLNARYNKFGIRKMIIQFYSKCLTKFFVNFLNLVSVLIHFLNISFTIRFSEIYLNISPIIHLNELSR